MRMHASWFGSQRPTGYKVAARTPRAATASSPRTRHPDHTERAAVLGSIKARPGNDGACGQRRAMADLDSPCARRPPTHVGRGEETGFQIEQRNWYEGSGECREIVLDFESPIQGRDNREHEHRPKTGAPVLHGFHGLLCANPAPEVMRQPPTPRSWRSA